MGPQSALNRATASPLERAALLHRGATRIAQVATRAIDLDPVVAEIARVLAETGYDPARVYLAVLTVHPTLAGIGFAWTSENGQVSRHERAHGFLDSDEHRQSPLHLVMSSGQMLRLRFDSAAVESFPIVREMAQRGATDYVALPIAGMRGDLHALTVFTHRPGGWSDVEVDDLHLLLPVLALAVGVFEERRLSRAIAQTYLGRRTGDRVLAGELRRGGSERVRAAVWFSDLRSFTDLTQRHGDEAIVEALDGWFELAVEAVHRHDGEVLKFMGDALLALFPVRQSWEEAIEGALAAADEVKQGEARATLHHGLPLHGGVALHAGEVVYGNVGAPGRLDFTALGTAVNTTARISGLCGSLGEPTLLSAAAAQHARRPMRSCGQHKLRGLPDPVELLSPSDARAAVH